ncbi:DUF6183 family protein [Spirillospora sp. NPDC029432]|uniref:DUF6183 family protein n=1 Tax=Spirillospora sp. NPDC029432 TaxID=3154599 RepID=UPI0034568DB8
MEIGEAVRRMGLARNHRDRHWKTAVQVTDRTIRNAEPEWLEELLEALLQVGDPTYPMCYGFPVALQRLATTPGDVERIRSVRRIAAEGKTWGDVRYELAGVASWLAAAQPLDHLLAFLGTADAADELAACLLQETALRHDANGASGFARRLRAAGHPLAELPLRRTPAERRHGLPHYPGLPQPEWHAPGERTPAPGPAGIDLTATELGWPAADRALSAHRAWVSGGGECTEARLYSLDRPLAPADFGASLLRLLTADSTGGGLDEVSRATTADVLHKLFQGATGGSAYGPGLGGAYGRLASWESLAALAGADGGGTSAVERAADRCAWLFYTSGWHLQVHPSMDVGIAVLRPDGRTVAVLAATDSD